MPQPIARERLAFQRGQQAGEHVEVERLCTRVSATKSAAAWGSFPDTMR